MAIPDVDIIERAYRHCVQDIRTKMIGLWAGSECIALNVFSLFGDEAIYLYGLNNEKCRAVNGHRYLHRQCRTILFESAMSINYMRVNKYPKPGSKECGIARFKKKLSNTVYDTPIMVLKREMR
jgi:hypothetical protein